MNDHRRNEPANNPQRDREIRRVLFIEGLANLCVLLAKLAVGITTNSTAILGDALHSLTDLANNGIALVAARISASPPDAEHPYGHRKFETLAVFLLASLLSAMAIEIIIRALSRIGQPIEHSQWGLVVMGGVLVINTALTSWERYWANRLDSDLLRADTRHTAGDVLTTIAIILGWQFAARGYLWLDTVLALVVAGLIFYLAYGLYRRAIPILVDQEASNTYELRVAVRALPGVQNVKRIRSRYTGSGTVADLVITVDPGLSTEESHRIADDVENLLAQRFGIIDTSVHIEPSG